MIQKFKRWWKKKAALFLAGIMLCTTLLPNAINAITLTDAAWNDPLVAPSWGQAALDAADSRGFDATGLAFNGTPFNRNMSAGDLFPFAAAAHLTARPGQLNDEYSDFDNRYIYCVQNHVQNYRLNYGSQAFHSGTYQIGANESEDRLFEAAKTGKTNPRFNFLMLAIATYYPGPNVDAESTENIPYYLACQAIAWLATYETSSGFAGTDFNADLSFFQNSEYYRSLMGPTATFTQDVTPDIYNFFHSAPAEGSEAKKAGITNMLDGIFYDVWHIANLTSQLKPDWDKEITEAIGTMEEKDGEYHVYLDLFSTPEAAIYLNGITFAPYGDWQYLGNDENGRCHFKSTTGEFDENGSIGYLYWPDNGLYGALMPVDITKAKLYTFIFYNDTAANPNQFKLGNSQTYFCSVMDQGLNLYVTIGDDDNPDNPGTGTSTGQGSYTIDIDRFEHQENFTATYNVNLLKYDSETGKPLADSHWDVLEAFDDSQLDDTDLDRAPDAPGEYTSGLGSLNSTSWGDDEISSNYSGNTGVTESDTNKYNWGNDSGTQFDRWDDPLDDPCMRDENVTGEDGLLYEIDSSGRISNTLAHTDVKGYTYNKGYCTGHPAPTINYVECDHDADEDCDCDEINQELHDEAWAAWYEEVKKCEQLVEEGGFFHCIDPGDTAKEAMQSDRDEFFKDFISLTYDYSAMEIAAPKGYILHGTHTDDIPIEWRTVTSSEYKDTDEATVLEHTGGGSDSEDTDDTELEEAMESLGNVELDENNGQSFLTSDADRINSPDSDEDEDEAVWESAGYAECYFFDGNGYMMSNTVSADGFRVNADGAWVDANGVVQTRSTAAQPAQTTDNQTVNTNVALNSDNGGYNEYGCSNAAIEMLHNTRTQNAKFGEVSVNDWVSYISISYANGFYVNYPADGSGMYKTVGVDTYARPELDETYLFKYFDPSLNVDEAADYLHSIGFADGIDGTYSNGITCWVSVDSDSTALNWRKDSIVLR